MARRITAELLKSPNRQVNYSIWMQLQEQKTAEFIFNDRELAEAQYNFLQGHLALLGLAIKRIEFREVPVQ